MPITHTNPANDPIVFVGTVRVEIDPADAQAVADLSALYGDIEAHLAAAADAVVSAAVRPGGSVAVIRSVDSAKASRTVAVNDED